MFRLLITILNLSWTLKVLSISGFLLEDYDFSGFDFSGLDFSGSDSQLYSTPLMSTDYSMPKVSLDFSMPLMSADFSMPLMSVDYSMPKVSLDFSMPSTSSDFSMPLMSVDYSMPKVSLDFSMPLMSSDYSMPLMSADLSMPTMFSDDSHSETEFPTFYPTWTPTAVPSKIPSFVPTVAPSVVPTQAPTAAPTAQPITITAAPTRSGETTLPTRSPTLSPTRTPTTPPTLAPTQSLLERWRPVIADYVQSAGNIGLRDSLYVEIYDANQNQKVRGGCNAFSSFVADDLYAKLIALTPIRLIFASTASPSDSISSKAEICSGSRLTADPLDDIIAAFTKPAASGVETLTTVTCSGKAWVAGTCASGKPAICVGCTNPCSNTTLHYGVSCAAAAGRNRMNLLKVDFSASSLPADIVDINVTAQGTTALKVHVAVSAAEGSLVCAAYLSSAAFVPGNVGRVAVGRQVVSITSRSMEYIVPGLRPASMYDVYCGTLSAIGAPMSSAAVQATKASNTTGCCRTVTVTLSTTSFRDDRDMPNALSINVGSFLPSDLFVEISASYRPGTSGAYTPVAYTFMPARRHFQLTSPSSQNQFAYNRSAVGYYQLTATLTGTSASKYAVGYPTGTTFQVKLSTVQPIPPLMSKAQFAANGASLRVTFNSPTNRGGATNVLQNCQDFFTVAGLSYATRCVWQDDFNLDIFASGNGGPIIGGSLAVKANKIKAACTTVPSACGSWNYTSAHSVTIGTALSPLTPNVVISGPSEVGACDSVSIDLGRSTGGGGRDWTSIVFSVESSAINRSDVEAYLNAVIFKTRQITIPNGLLNLRKTYAISVKMCNFLGQCGQDSLPFVVSSSTNVPVVSIKSDKKFTVNRFNKLSLAGDAYINQCGGQISRSKLTFVWTIYENDALLADVAYRSVSKDPREFLLEPFTLTVGSIYTITLTVTHGESQKYSTASVEVAVVQGEIIAVVDKPAQFGLRVSESATVSAAKSYDQDYKSVEGAAAGLTFDLRCVRIVPTFSTSCGLTIVDHGDGSATFSVPGSDVSFEASVYQLTVFVQHTASERSAEKTIQMTILPSASAMVSLSIVGSSTINPSNKVAFRASIQYPTAGNAQWSVDDPLLILATTSSSLVQRPLPAPPTGTSLNIETSLIIPKDILQEMSTYTFSLKVTLDSGLVTTSSIVVVTNAPPSMGRLVVSPPNGTEYKTVFVFLASQFEDPDLPLSYEFAISSTNKFSVFRERQTVTYAQSFLPKGPDTMGHAFETRVQVYDVLDGKTIAYGQVIVEESLTALNTTQIKDDISSSLSEGSISDITAAASIVSGIVNSAQCVAAPDCHYLNRENCSKVDNTCGKCREGYSGRGRYANTKCVSESLFTRRLSFEARSSTCTADADCNGDLYEVCSSGTCSPAPLACPSSCSGKGECKFYNKYEEDGDYLSSCTVLSTNCLAKCECITGYGGSGCQYTTAEFADAQALRHLVVQAYETLVATQTPTVDVVVAWIDGLIEIASFPEDLSLTSKLLMVDVASDILDIATSLSLSYEDIAELKTVLDLTLDAINADRRRRLDTDSDRLVIGLFQAYASFLLEDMLPDQLAITIATDLYRITANSYDGLNGVTLALPRVGTEIVAGTPAHEIQLAEDDGGSYKVLLFELLVLVHASGADSLLQSVPLSMMLDRSLCDGATGDIDVCSFNVTLNNFEYGQHTSPQELEVTTYCEAGVVQDYTYSCPSGIDLVVSCDGQKDWIIYSPCPVRYPSSNCSSLGLFDAVCETVFYSETETVCKCSLPGTADALEVEVASTASSYVLRDGSTITYADPRGGSFTDNDSKTYAVVITTMITLAVTLVWALVVFIMGPSDSSPGKPAPEFEDMQQLDSALPGIYQRLGPFSRAWNEMARHHRWLSLVFGKSPLFGKDYQLLSLWTNVLIFFFLQSIVYNLADRDEQDCKKLITRSGCESDESFLALGEPKCRWDGTSKFCAFNEPDSSVLRVVFCAVFVAILTLPCSVLIDNLIAHVLCAATAGNEGVVQVSGDGFAGAALPGTAGVASPRKNLDAEYDEISANIAICSASLQGGEKSAFDASWKVGAEWKKKLLFAREEAQSEVRAMTLAGMTPAQKSKRILFLFFRDFLSGSPLAIVSAKYKRDHPTRRSVSGVAKVLAWMFLVCANVGMFAYVMVFGSNQSSERQHAWVYSYFAYLIMDIFLFSVAFVLWTHVFIPLCASTTVRTVKVSLIHVITEGRVGSGSPISPSYFNAAKYFFTSQRVASAFNNVEEQNPATHFSTIWPQSSFENKGIVPAGAIAADGCKSSVGSVVSKMPSIAHDIIFGLLFTVFFGFIVIAHIPLYRGDAVMGFVPLIVLAVCASICCVYLVMEGSPEKSKISPTPNVHARPIENQHVHARPIDGPQLGQGHDHVQQQGALVGAPSEISL